MLASGVAMPWALEPVYRLANVVLGGAMLMAAALVVVEIARHPTSRREPLGVVLCFLLLAVGVRASVRGVFEDISATPLQTAWTITAIDWLAAAAVGLGIAAAELARIWDPFYQVEPPMRRRHGGSGLGLTIVHRLIELHGGVVRAESEGENRGSRFSFTLPVAVEPIPADAALQTESMVERVLTGREVLIVEDDDASQALMRSVVEDALGGRARICADGEQAEAEATGRPPALILLDLMLPHVSGWEVARRLRQHPATRTLPIIAVSALARPQEREAALHAGCDAYLSKPFVPDELARLVTTTLLGESVAYR